MLVTGPFSPGYALVHQFVHIGPHCFVGPAAFVYHDVPAYVTAFGSPR